LQQPAQTAATRTQAQAQSQQAQAQVAASAAADIVPQLTMSDCIHCAGFTLTGDLTGVYAYEHARDPITGEQAATWAVTDDAWSDVAFLDVFSARQDSGAMNQHSNLTRDPDLWGDELEDIIIPGSEGSYRFTLYNSRDIDVFYMFNILEGPWMIDGAASGDEVIPFPLEYRLTSVGGTLDPAWGNWRRLAEFEGDIIDGMLPAGPGTSHVFYLEWIWPIDISDDQDAEDTQLGESVYYLDLNAEEQDGTLPFYQLQLNLHVCAVARVVRLYSYSNTFRVEFPYAEVTNNAGDIPGTRFPPDRAGYNFVGWFSDETRTTMLFDANGEPVPRASGTGYYYEDYFVGGVLSLYEHWEEESADNRVYLYIDGELISSFPYTTPPPQASMIPPPRPGYTFGGWFSEPPGEPGSVMLFYPDGSPVMVWCDDLEDYTYLYLYLDAFCEGGNLRLHGYWIPDGGRECDWPLWLLPLLPLIPVALLPLIPLLIGIPGAILALIIGGCVLCHICRRSCKCPPTECCECPPCIIDDPPEGWQPGPGPGTGNEEDPLPDPGDYLVKPPQTGDSAAIALGALALLALSGSMAALLRRKRREHGV